MGGVTIPSAYDITLHGGADMDLDNIHIKEMPQVNMAIKELPALNIAVTQLPTIKLEMAVKELPTIKLDADIGITGGGNGKHMVYLSGVTDHHVQSEAMLDHIVALVEAKAAELEAAEGQ